MNRAVLRYARAVRAWAEHNIARYDAGTDWLDEEWHRLDAEYAAAAAGLPRWLAGIVEWHVFRQLDYFRRTGQQTDGNAGRDIVAVAVAVAVAVTLSWLGPSRGHAPASPPAYYCPAGQHVTRVPAGLPECAR